MFYGVFSRNFDSEESKIEILNFAQQNQLMIKNFIYSDELTAVNSGDSLIVPNLSYFGLNMLKSLAAIVELGKKKIEIDFTEQPELSLSGEKLIDRLATFETMLKSERNFISARAKAGMAAAKAKGVKLGRKRGASKKVLALGRYKNEIKDYLEKKVSIVAIRKIINPSLDEELSYESFKTYIHQLNIN